MKKRNWTLLAVLAMLLLAVGALSAREVEKTDGFVCPVLGGQAGEDHGKSDPEPIVGISDGDSTVVGPEVSVPTHSTNQNGEGTPTGDHASPGDTDYTAIWGG
jgi:hypothetical protein